MKHSFVVFIIILSSLGACQKVDKPSIPKPLLEQSKMVELIADLIVLDASMSVNSKNLSDINVIPSQFIFQKYKLDSAQIAANLRYYNQNVSTNKELYFQAKVRVEAMKNNYDSIKAIKDSLRRMEIEEKQKKNTKGKTLKKIKL